MLEPTGFSVFVLFSLIGLVVGKSVIVKTEKVERTENSYSYSYSYKSSYSYSFSTYSSPQSSSYYYIYGYSASGYQPDSYKPYFVRSEKPSSNSWIELICDLLPFRSAYVSNRCFFTISKELLKGIPANELARSLFKDDFMQEVKMEIRLANVDREEIYQELLRSLIFESGVKYELGKHFKGGNSIVIGQEGKNSGILFEFGETHYCPDGYTRFDGQCYKFNPEPKPFNEALDTCEKSGGSLPAIENDDENRFVASIVRGQATWLATYWPKGSDKWEIAQRMSLYEPLEPKAPVYYRWLSFTNDTSHKNAVLFGTKTNPVFWFGYWANMDGSKVKQPFVCVTSILIGSYPDIIEPYPSGSNVSIIISSPNTTTIIPDKCCTAALPIVVEEVTPIPATTLKDEGNNEEVTIATPPAVVDVNQSLTELYRFVCNEGSCEAHHFYSLDTKGRMPCCSVEGKFVLTTDSSKAEIYDQDKTYIRSNNFGYCSPKQNYCGATLALYEIEIQYKHKKDLFYTTLDDEIEFLVSPKNTTYKALSTGIVCWTWPNSAITKKPQNETFIKSDCSGQGTSKKPSVEGEYTPKPRGYEDKVCKDDSCGKNADCNVVDGNIVCTCKVGYAGNAADLVNGCEVQVTCTEKSCGPNALCQVKNNAILCECKLGDPFDLKQGCRIAIAMAEIFGDPHYKTFDGTTYDYHGTCPYIFSMNCKPGNIAPYEDFKVKVRNSNVWAGQAGYKGVLGISRLAEVEVEFPTMKLNIHIDEKFQLYINNETERYDYYYPSFSDQKVSVVSVQKFVVIKRFDGLEIKITNQGVNTIPNLALVIPDVPQLQGPDKLCGLSGNRDKKCENDFTLRDGTLVSSTPKCHYKYEDKEVHNFGDSWIVPNSDFKDTMAAGELGKCQRGSEIARTDTCPKEKLGPALEICQPILDAKQGKGPFAGCQAFGSKLEALQESCAFDICTGTMKKCDAFATFVSQCQGQIPFAKIENWRKDTQCENEIKCPPNSHYTPCASRCASSCQKCHEEDGKQVCWGVGARIQKCEYQTVKVCNGDECRWMNEKICPPVAKDACIDSCMEGCECDNGYVMDKNKGFQCVKGCPAGSYMPVDSSYDVPLLMPLKGTIKPVWTFYVHGYILPNASYIAFSFVCGSPYVHDGSTTALQFVIYDLKDQANQNKIKGAWGELQAITSPCSRNRDFLLTIRANQDNFEVFTDFSKIATFPYRLPVETITNIQVAGGLLVKWIEPNPYPIIPPVPRTPNYLEKPIQPGQTLVIRGQLLGNAKLVCINLLEGSEIKEGGNTILHVLVDIGQNRLILTSMIKGQWAKGMILPNPLKPGDYFEIAVLALEDHFDLYVNLLKIESYKYLLPLNMVHYYNAYGNGKPEQQDDITIDWIHWTTNSVQR